MDLSQCTYVPESSLAGQVECVRMNPQQSTVIFMALPGQCEELLRDLRTYLTGSWNGCREERLCGLHCHARHFRRAC